MHGIAFFDLHIYGLNEKFFCVVISKTFVLILNRELLWWNGKKKECAMKRVIFSIFPIMLATAFTAASAFTLTGTVKNESGDPISGASVKLIVKGDSAKTDSQGKFKIEKVEAPPSSSSVVESSSSGNVTPPDRILGDGFTPGYINISKGILHFSQSPNSPVQVGIYDMMGNQVLRQTLRGTGQVDLRQGVKAQGTYIARVHVGNAQQVFKFTTDGTVGRSYFASQKGALLKVEDDSNDTLFVTAKDYDTLRVYLSKLDTNVEITLKKPKIEQTYAFGYPLKNEPTPSKGCGKDNTLKNYFKFTGGGIEHEVYLDVPDNYDKNKPYRLVFGMHCMGGSAQNVAKNEHYYGYRDKDKTNTIFVAPHGYTDNMPWRCGDDKDHKFFDELLTHLNENLCVDTSRVFSSGFSFGAMFSNSLAQVFQHRLRGVVVFATADQVIYIPKNAGKPIAWMGTVGLSDGTCPPSMGRSARDRILKNNGPEGHTDCTSEKATEFSGNGNHVCYDYKTVDPRFPVKWCSFNGGHQWDMRENGKLWASDIGWEFITQF